MISVFLEQQYERPAFNIISESGVDVLCLFDTGSDKRMEIHPLKERAAYCVPRKVLDPLADGFILEKNEIFIKGVTVFWDVTGDANGI